MLTPCAHDIMIFGENEWQVAFKKFLEMNLAEGENDEMGIPDSRERSWLKEQPKYGFTNTPKGDSEKCSYKGGDLM